MALAEYRKKRDFRGTAEPKGKTLRGDGQVRFVIQKHAATRLHDDFRLEVGGTLKSWAVPKGVPLHRGEKHLAIRVEDHPVSYIDFEGTIPKGQYGGGTVMVWDRGTFQSRDESPAKALEGGKLTFNLSGEKLRGEWSLVRMRDKEQWLLIKGKDDVQLPAGQAETSVLSGRTMLEIAENGKEWNSRAVRAASKPKKPPRRQRAERWRFVEPMKARPVKAPPPGDWAYEIKFDGYRALACKSGKDLRLLSRNEKDLRGKFPEIAGALAGFEAADAVVDGEIVALDARGRSKFQLLQQREMGQSRPELFFYLFDLLYLDGRDLLDEPLEARKARLEKLLEGAPDRLRFSASLGGKASELLKKIRRLGLEGLIGKRKGSKYEPGRRSGAWIKLKVEQEQELVIGGYTNPAGGRERFGSLLVGYQEKDRLKFAGKVGTGFDGALLEMLYARFHKLPSGRCPFAGMEEAGGGEEGFSRAQMKRCHWLKPQLVCQVKFHEWTETGKLRHPVFLGLREDKEAGEVVRERPV